MLATRSPRETLEAFIDAYNRQDMQGLHDLMAVDFSRASASSGWKIMSRDMYLDMSKRWDAAFVDSKWELLDMVENGQSIVAEFIESGRLVNPYEISEGHVIQPNGQTYTGRATVWFTFNGVGQVATYRYYSDGGFLEAYHDVIAASGDTQLVTAT